MDRRLATIQIIDKVSAIDGADFIEVATIKGWKAVIQKGEFKKGDFCIYCEIDSFLPIHPEFEFLRASSYKKLSDNTEGYRIKTRKLKKVISQGLVLPVNLLQRENKAYQIGEDVSEILNIIKYTPPIPAHLSGEVKGNFPSFIPKTDEERIQNIPEVLENSTNVEFYTSEKLDGTSSTYYVLNHESGVCSRNLELKETENNTYWKIEKQYDILRKLDALNLNIALQGEIIGEGINKNKYKLKGQKIFFFNVYFINERRFAHYHEFIDIIDRLEYETVPIVDDCFYIRNQTIDSLLLLAEGQSKLYSAAREGIVVKQKLLDKYNNRISFKVVNNQYLLKNEN